MSKKAIKQAPATPAKSPESEVPMRVPEHGRGLLRSGGTDNGGAGGRPPDAWKAKMAKLADRWAQAAEAQRVLDDPDHPHWMRAGQFASEQAHGKPTQPISGDVDAPLVIRVVRET